MQSIRDVTEDLFAQVAIQLQLGLGIGFFEQVLDGLPPAAHSGGVLSQSALNVV
jgi:hypothetical protein